jgi:RimJ/RimL family protein N-acetyltransferase/GNAT superfamily N-acetyltransferase
MSENPKPARIIVGSRIQLLARTDDQAAELFALIDRNREHLGKWMPWEQTTKAVQDSADYIKLTEKWWDQGSTFDFALFEIATSKMIGSTGLHSINWSKKTCEIGYWISQSHEGKGYITEAVQLAETVAGQLGFHQVLITCDRLNLRSQQIPKRLNYRLEAVQIDDCINHHGNVRDTLQFVKLINPKIEGCITENMPTGYCLKELNSDDFWEQVEKKMEIIFADDLSYSVQNVLSEVETVKLKILSENFKRPCVYHFVILHNETAVGWTWGYQDSKESVYMVKPGILPEHRGKGLYSKLLQTTVEKLVQKGFQRIWSRHNCTNNEIIIPKLKHGFQITGSELSDVFGSLVHLTYFANPTRRKIMHFRSGHLSPDVEVKKVFKL